MNGLKISVLMLTLFAVLFLPSVVAADLDEVITIKEFEVNGADMVFASGEEVSEELERGDDIEVFLRIEALEDVEDLEIQAFIAGDKYVKNRRDLTYDFDTYRGMLDAGNAKTFRLDLQIPQDLEIENNDDYKLRIVIADANSDGVFAQDFQLTIEGVAADNAVVIDDFSFSPNNVVVGRAFTGLVRVENLGDEPVDNLKVTVSVPDLDIEDTQYLDSDDELDPDDTQTFEELLLRVPTDAAPGTYQVEVLVEFDKYYDVVEYGTIKVVEEKSASGSKAETYVTATPTQEFGAGTSAVYPILIENGANQATTYSVTVSGVGEWGAYVLEPSSVVTIDGGSKDTVLLTITANDDASNGEKAFVVTVDTPNGPVQKALTANIVDGNNGGTDWGKVQDGLTIGLIILVIILIILGLIIGFSKLRGSSDKDDETQTYY